MTKGRVATILGTAVALEVLVWQQGILTTLLALYAAILLVRRRPGGLMFAAAAASAGILWFANARVAGWRAKELAAAIDRYCGDQGVCPANLTELVPRYMSSIPRAKIALTFSEFRYTCYREPTLRWSVYPPFDFGTVRVHGRCRSPTSH